MLSGYYEDKLTIHLVMESPCGGGGGRGTRPIFGYGLAADPDPIYDQKFLKYIPCLGRHPQF